MTLIMFMCLKNLDANLELGMGKTLNKQSKHIGALEGLVQKSAEYMERMGIISASFITLISIIDFWELRKDILTSVQQVFEFVINQYENLNYREYGDKALVCLTLVLILKFLQNYGV